MSDDEKATVETIFAEVKVALEANRKRPDPHGREEGVPFQFEDNLIYLNKVIHELSFLPVDLAYDVTPYEDVTDVLVACLEWLLALRTQPDLFELKSNEVIH